MAPACRLIDRVDFRCLQSLGAGGDLEGNALAFLQRLEAGALDFGEMREEISAAIIRSHEAETLGIVEPLNSTCCHVLYP